MDIVNLILSVGFVLTSSLCIITGFRLRELGKRNSSLKKERNHLKDSYDRLKKVTLMATYRAQELERERISSGMHDEINSCLTTLKINLDVLYRNQNIGNREIFFSEMYDILAEVVKRNKEIIWDISPVYLQQFGLVQTINQLCNRINNSYTIKAEFSNKGEIQCFSSDTELLIYRIVQELVNNSAKYSNAWKIKILLDWLPSSLSLTISDSGVGESNYNPLKGTGLANIKNRVTLLNGHVVIDANEYGSYVKVSIPYEKAEQNKSIHCG